MTSYEQSIHIGPREFFNQVELIGRGIPFAIDPERFVVADRIHDKRFALPVTDVVTVVARHERLRVRPPVHIDDARRMRPADIHDVDLFQFGDVDELNAVPGS